MAFQSPSSPLLPMNFEWEFAIECEAFKQHSSSLIQIHNTFILSIRTSIHLFSHRSHNHLCDHNQHRHHVNNSTRETIVHTESEGRSGGLGGATAADRCWAGLRG